MTYAFVETGEQHRKDFLDFVANSAVVLDKIVPVYTGGRRRVTGDGGRAALDRSAFRWS